MLLVAGAGELVIKLRLVLGVSEGAIPYRRGMRTTRPGGLGCRTRH